MIKQHELNRTESVELLNLIKSMEYADDIHKKQCYNNIWTVTHNHSKPFLTGEWKIAYGYVSIDELSPIMGRHCFIVNSKGEVVDPTLPLLDHFDSTEYKYISFATLDFREYLDKIQENDLNPDMFRVYMDYERTVVYNWAKDKGIMLI